MALRDQNKNKGFLISADADLDLSILNKAMKKVLTAIKSILTLGWIPGGGDVDPDNFDVNKAKEAEMAKQGNIANMAHLYSRTY